MFGCGDRNEHRFVETKANSFSRPWKMHSGLVGALGTELEQFMDGCIFGRKVWSFLIEVFGRF